jgi:hypothetical protein
MVVASLSHHLFHQEIRESGAAQGKKKPTVETAGANDCLLYE